METLDAIHTRRSVRQFTDRPVPTDILREILKAGVRAPNAGNRQPWRFVVVTDREKIRQFDPVYHQACVEKAPGVIVACADPHTPVLRSRTCCSRSTTRASARCG